MSDPASKRLGHHSNIRIRNDKLLYLGTRNVAIYAFSSGKCLNVGVYACVKKLANIMSVVIVIVIMIIVIIPGWQALHAVSRQGSLQVLLTPGATMIIFYLLLGYSFLAPP